MLSKLLVASSLYLAATSLSPALAACGPGKIPTYSDIDAVSYERTMCFGKCSAYQVVFRKNGDCYYVGYKYVSKLGTYGQTCISEVLKRATRTLQSHDFYSLNYDSSELVLDVPHFLVAAERCGVTTKLDWPAYQDRRDIESLLDSLDAITAGIRWHKISNSTADMDQWFNLP